MSFRLLLLLAAASSLLASPALPDEVRVTTSSTHTFVIGPDGAVLCQGWNQHRVCGAAATVKFVEKLSSIPGLPKGRAVAVADPWTSMVLGENGTVYVWGQNNFGLFGGTDRGPVYVR
jgi:alpha-tubulin suppressor-like RCC1 family protein